MNIPDEAELTYDKCEKCKRQNLYKWIESRGGDDYYKVWYCPSCEEKMQE